jgi:hypothetical protein
MIDNHDATRPTELRRRLPHHLRKVVVRRIRRVVVSCVFKQIQDIEHNFRLLKRTFVENKLLHGLGNGKVAGRGDDVLAVRRVKQRAIRVFDLTGGGPAGRPVCERCVPYLEMK